jgi:hypothetical protein
MSDWHTKPTPSGNGSMPVIEPAIQPGHLRGLPGRSVQAQELASVGVQEVAAGLALQGHVPPQVARRGITAQLRLLGQGQSGPGRQGCHRHSLHRRDRETRESRRVQCWRGLQKGGHRGVQE